MSELMKRILTSIILIPIVIICIIKGYYFFEILILISLAIAVFEWHKICNHNNYKKIGYIIIFLSFFLTYKLRYEFNNEYFNFLIVITICVFTDIGGYTFGKIFKGPKITKISPKKTYSGMIGGYILSMISIKIFFDSNLILDAPLNFSLYFLLFVISVSTVSQIGDIFISYFKRLSGVKNTGNILPGHGGLLDRVDGMIFAFPFSYIVLKTNLFSIF